MSEGVGQINTDHKLTILGAGILGCSITAIALGHGIPVVLVDSDQDALDQAFGTVAALLREASTLRALPAETLRATLATRTSVEQGGDATAVVEAVPESAVAKAKALSAICKVVPPGTPLLSGTSAIPIDEIAAWTGRPPDVIGTRFLSPPYLTKTVELVRARHTSDRTLQAATNLMRAFGRKTITVSDSPGFVVSRVIYPMINAAARLVGTGVATVEGIDALMRAWFPDSDGPLRTADRIGLDDLVHTLYTIYDRTGDESCRPCRVLLDLVHSGHLGCKSGRGFYDYNLGEQAIREIGTGEVT